MARCNMCFQSRSVAPPVPGALPICKGCAFQVERTLGFLEASGLGLQFTQVTTGELRTLAEAYAEAMPPQQNPPDPPKNGRRPTGTPVDVPQVGSAT